MTKSEAYSIINNPKWTKAINTPESVVWEAWYTLFPEKRR